MDQLLESSQGKDIFSFCNIPPPFPPQPWCHLPLDGLDAVFTTPLKNDQRGDTSLPLVRLLIKDCDILLPNVL